MATAPTPQRAYRAACPNCGAPVEFRSAASPYAVCGFCRSMVVRDGDALKKIGESAELFDDHTPLQLGAAGRWQGAAFTLIGRLQCRYEGGSWNEWHALFETSGDAGRGDGEAAAQKSGWLSEDNGRYVFAFDAPLAEPLPPLERLRPGAPLTVDGRRWSVASVVVADLAAAEGELPKRPPLGRRFQVADLRDEQGEVGTLDDADPAALAWSVGRSVDLADLSLVGLAEPSTKTLAARTLACPNCGAALDIRLQTTRSIVCRQCRSVVDVDAAGAPGLGGALAYYRQTTGAGGDDANDGSTAGRAEPLLPLGSTGELALGGAAKLPWQVVGYVERCEVPEPGDDDAEQTFWREYLLYHRLQGFAFLVDADDGWSTAVPVTGAPQTFGAGEANARYQGVVYRKLYDYRGRITYVLGEFYWRLTQGETTANTDYAGTGAASAKRLNRERTTSAAVDGSGSGSGSGGGGDAEVVWSAGESIPAATVADAFALAADRRAALRPDAAPTAFKRSAFLSTLFVGMFFVAVLLLLFRCDGGGAGDCEETRQTYGEASQEYQNCRASRQSGAAYRTGGGAFGGYSSGGSHK